MVKVLLILWLQNYILCLSLDTIHFFYTFCNRHQILSISDSCTKLFLSIYFSADHTILFFEKSIGPM